jgi:hypothetical protein
MSLPRRFALLTWLGQLNRLLPRNRPSPFEKRAKLPWGENLHRHGFLAARETGAVITAGQPMVRWCQPIKDSCSPTASSLRSAFRWANRDSALTTPSFTDGSLMSKKSRWYTVRGMTVKRKK